MKPYYEDDNVTIYHGDCREIVSALGWDVLITDPPYIGREDLFDTTDVNAVLSSLIEDHTAFVFWPCLPPPPVAPDAVHIWHKAVPIHPNSTTGNAAGHHYERILSYGMGTRCDVFRVAAVMPGFAACSAELEDHPTQKPLALLSRLVARSPSGTILDPYMGTGTTIEAAKNHGRKAIGVEIEERYCEIAAKRCAQEVLDFAGAAA